MKGEWKEDPKKMAWEFIAHIGEPICIEFGNGTVGVGCTTVKRRNSDEKFPAITLERMTDKHDIGDGLPLRRNLEDVSVIMTFTKPESLDVLRKMIDAVEKKLNES
jgi:hypothetical protein